MFLVVFVLVSLLLRLGRFDFPASYTFAWGDGTRDFLVASHIVKYHELVLTGPFNLLQGSGIHNSPLYFYILSLFLLPFNNILTLSLVNIILQLGVIVLIYHITKKLFDYPTAVVATLLLGLNPEVIKQADFVWQPYLMLPLALAGLYLLIRSYWLISLVFLSVAAALHNSAFTWLPVFLFFGKKSFRFYIGALGVIFFILFLLYSPVLIYNSNNLTHLFHKDPLFVNSPAAYLANFGQNTKQLLNTFYLKNLPATLLLVLLLVTLKKDLSKRKPLILLLALFILSIIFVSFFNKFRLHYLILSLGVLPILAARAISIFKPALRFTLALILILIFSGNFAYIREFKKPLQNQQRIDQITSVIVSELNRVKQENKFSDFDFFRVSSYAVSEVTIPYPVLDTFLLVPLEEKLGRKLAQNSDASPYNHIQLNEGNYLVLSCYKFAKKEFDCPGYNNSKMIYNDESVNIYIAKHE